MLHPPQLIPPLTLTNSHMLGGKILVGNKLGETINVKCEAGNEDGDAWGDDGVEGCLVSGVCVKWDKVAGVGDVECGGAWKGDTRRESWGKGIQVAEQVRSGFSLAECAAKVE